MHEFKIDITIITIKDVYSPAFISILKEGWSIRNAAFISEILGIQPTILYKYSIKMLNPIQKVQFDRGLKKQLELAEGTRLTRTVVLIPMHHTEQFEAFLKTWKIEFETKRYTLLPEHQKKRKMSA